MASGEKLEPCPGCKKTDMLEKSTNAYKVQLVTCHRCGWQAPLNLWNRRAPVPDAETDGGVDGWVGRCVLEGYKKFPDIIIVRHERRDYHIPVTVTPRREEVKP